MGTLLVVFPFALLAGLTDPAVMLGAALLCGACGLHRWARRVLSAIFVVMALALGVALFTPLVPWSASSLAYPRTEPRAADAIVVLAGGAYCGGRELDAASLGRLVTALELWRSGYARTLTLSAAPTAHPTCPTVADLQSDLVRRLYPVSPPELVTVTPGGSGTRFEAIAVARAARVRGWKTVLLVTSPTHLRRATAAFERAGVTVLPVASSEPRYERALWDLRSRFHALPAIAREYAGYVKYKLHGWW